MNSADGRRRQACAFGLNAIRIMATGLAMLLPSACLSVNGHKAGTAEFSFVQLCDPQLGMGGYDDDMRRFRQAVSQINALAPDFVLICGDFVQKPTDQSFADFSAIMDRFTVPVYAVPGNHDVLNQPTPESLRRYRHTIGKDCFAFHHKGHAFICVNTSLWKSPIEGETERMDEWLHAELEKAAQHEYPAFIVGHYPLYLKTPDEAENYGNLPTARRQALLHHFQESGVVAVLSGHAHRVIVNDYAGMQLVTGETTSRTHGHPLGFRMWQIGVSRPYNHESIPLEDL